MSLAASTIRWTPLSATVVFATKMSGITFTVTMVPRIPIYSFTIRSGHRCQESTDCGTSIAERFSASSATREGGDLAEPIVDRAQQSWRPGYPGGQVLAGNVKLRLPGSPARRPLRIVMGYRGS